MWNGLECPQAHTGFSILRMLPAPFTDVVSPMIFVLSAFVLYYDFPDLELPPIFTVAFHWYLSADSFFSIVLLGQ